MIKYYQADTLDSGTASFVIYIKKNSYLI